MAKKPTMNDFIKQFKRDRPQVSVVSGTSAEVAEAVADMAEMTPEDFLKTQLKTWEFLTEECMKGLMKATVFGAKQETQDKLINACYRFHSMQQLMELLLSHLDDEHRLDPPQSYIDEIREEVAKLVEEARREGGL
jgi:hypothetical protein